MINHVTTQVITHRVAEAANGSYPSGIKVTDTQMAAVSKVLKPHTFHGERNYTIRPGITPA